VYQRTYSRLVEEEDGTARKEQWFETVERVVNGTYNMQKRWIEQHGLGWNPWRAQRSAQVRDFVEGRGCLSTHFVCSCLLFLALRLTPPTVQEMYDRIFNMKFLPPGRGLWAMGSPITEQRQLCVVVSHPACVVC